MKNITVEILTPECCVLRKEADMVVAGTVGGECGVLAGHMPLIAALAKGKLRVVSGAETTHVAVDGGILNVSRDTVTIMAVQARIWADVPENQKIGA
jgi:F-type H+-transporting ATPase subunit epsilon